MTSLHMKIAAVVLFVSFQVSKGTSLNWPTSENGSEYTGFGELIGETNDSSGQGDCTLGELDLVHDVLSMLFLSTSIVTCVVAFYMYFLVRNIPAIMKDSKRHWIHWNLMMSFILRDVLTLTIMAVINVYTRKGRQITQAQIRMMVISFAYTQSTNCFWMFVEGFYLLLGLIIHMRLRQLSWMKLRLGLIGWGVPGVSVAIWGIQQKVTDGNFNIEELAGRLIVTVPMYLVLLANFVIIIRVLYTLRGMLRLDVDQPQKDTMRAMAKRTLILSILLGIYFLIPAIIHAVVDDVIKASCQISAIIVFINSIFSSLYGFLVATLYVLLDHEIMSNAVRHLPTCLQGPIRNLRHRTQSSSSNTSSSSQKTKLSIINNNCHKTSVSANPTPRASDRTSAVAQSEYSMGHKVCGTHLALDESPSVHHELEEDAFSARFTETTFAFNEADPNPVHVNVV